MMKRYVGPPSARGDNMRRGLRWITLEEHLSRTGTSAPTLKRASGIHTSSGEPTGQESSCPEQCRATHSAAGELALPNGELSAQTHELLAARRNPSVGLQVPAAPSPYAEAAHGAAFPSLPIRLPLPRPPNVPPEEFLKRKFKLPRFDCWVEIQKRIPHVLAQVVWERIDGARLPYHSWTKAEQDELRDSVKFICEGQDTNLPEAPPSTVVQYGDGSVFATLFQPAVARSYFIAFVARSLTAEVLNWVGWSIADYPSKELEYLFDSRTLFKPLQLRNAYGIIDSPSHFRFGNATLGDPVGVVLALITPAS